MTNINELMKQAQDMQRKMNELQDRLGETDISGHTGGGLVVVTLNGKAEMKKIRIDSSLLKPNEGEMLEDLIVAAFSDAKAKVEAHIGEQMQQLTSGMKLPPGLLPGSN